MPALGHCLVRVHVELAVTELRRVQEHAEVLVSVLRGVEAEAHRWPAVLVLDVLVAVTKDVVDEDELGVTRVCHAMIAHEDNVDDVREVARLDLVVELAREDVDLLENFL